MIWYIILYALGMVFSTATYIRLSKYARSEEEACKFMVGFLVILKTIAVAAGFMLLFFEWEILKNVAAFLLGFASPLLLGKKA